MCLDSRHTKKEMDEWLKSQPDIITAYKLVEKIKINKFVEKRKIEGEEYKLIPLYRSEKTEEYKKKNRIRGDRPRFSSHRSYKAYFHLWLEMPGDYEESNAVIFIECHVPKHLITAIGTDDKIETIVSKGFDIVKEC